MKRKTVIVIIPPAGVLECYGNLKKACIAHGWSYNTLSKMKLPIEYVWHKIHRVKFQ